MGRRGEDLSRGEGITGDKHINKRLVGDGTVGRDGDLLHEFLDFWGGEGITKVEQQLS